MRFFSTDKPERLDAERRSRDFSRRAFIKSFGIGLPSAILCAKYGASKAAAQTPSSILTELFPGVTLKFRNEWAWCEPRYRRLSASNGFSRITIHHEGTLLRNKEDIGSVASQLSNILAGHLNKDFGDIGYHYMIDREGRVWEGRSTDYEGAHVASANAANLGVMLMGNFEEQEPSEAQISAMHMTLIALIRRYSISYASIFGHCDLAASACPGKKLYQPHVIKFRDLA